MKKLVVLIITLMAITLCSSASIVYADNVSYTYEDESAIAVFTLKDDSTYECTTTNKETNDVANFTSTYVFNENKITFYLNGEILLDAEIGENNVLIEIEDEIDFDLKEYLPTEESVSRVVEWIIAGVLGLLGTLCATLAFGKQLKSLVNLVMSALTNLTSKKEEYKTQIDDVIEEAKSTIKKLNETKEEIKEVTKEDFAKLNEKILLLSKVVIYMAGGMKELVINGTSETISELLQKPNKEVNIDEDKEI